MEKKQVIYDPSMPRPQKLIDAINDASQKVKDFHILTKKFGQEKAYKMVFGEDMPTEEEIKQRIAMLGGKKPNSTPQASKENGDNA